MCGVPPPSASPTSWNFVRCPHPNLKILLDIPNLNVPCSPPNSWTSYQFSCQSSSTCISECGTPSSACCDFYLTLLYHKHYHIFVESFWRDFKIIFFSKMELVKKNNINTVFQSVILDIIYYVLKGNLAMMVRMIHLLFPGR